MGRWVLLMGLSSLAVLFGGCDLAERKSLLKRMRRLDVASRNALEREDYPAALAALSEMDQTAPGNPSVLYNLACASARAGDPERAVAALAGAAKNGWTPWEHATEDPDLRDIRNDARFPGIMEAMKANAKEFREATADPYAAVSGEPCPAASSVKAIRAYFDGKRQRLRETAPLMGPWPTHERDWRYLRGEIDALQAYLASRARTKDAPEAYMAVVSAFADLHRPVGFSGAVRAATAARMKAVVDEFRTKQPDSPLVQEARYVLLESELQAAMTELWDADAEGPKAWTELTRRFGGAFADLADEAVGSKAEGLALAKALQLGVAAERSEAESNLVARLTASMKQYKEVERLAWKNASVQLLRVTGTPDFTATDTEGQSWSLEACRGRLLVLDFWATWCGPCLRELPEMKKLYDEFHGQGVGFLGVPLEFRSDMPLDKFTRWCRDQGVAWPQVYEGRGWEHPLAAQFRITGVPTLVFIDAKGRVAGEGRAHAAEHWIRNELGLPPPDGCGSTNTERTVQSTDPQSSN